MERKDESRATAPAAASLPQRLPETLRSLNPWWQGEAGVAIPAFRRWAFAQLLQLVTRGLAPATLLRGPRRVGKTVLARQIIAHLLEHGTDPRRILYVPFDEIGVVRSLTDPILEIGRWFERAIMGRTFNAAARGGETAYVFFDEVQNLRTWAPQLKHLVDNHNCRVLVTGSSSLRIAAGRDSLAGRVLTFDLGPLLLRDIAGLRFGHREPSRWPPNGQGDLAMLDFWRANLAAAASSAEVRRAAFAAFAASGGFPLAHQPPAPTWPQVSDHLMETVIRRVLAHDVPAARRGRRVETALVEQVFRLAARYAGQNPGWAIFRNELRDALHQDYSWGRVQRILGTLDETMLLRLVRPLELRLKRQAAPAKLCLCDHALRAAWLQEEVPLDPEGLARNPHLCDLAGRLAESVLGYFLSTIPNLDVSCFPARPTEEEVDFVVTVGTKRIPIEVKYRKRIDPHEDTRGLRAFIEKSVYNAPMGLLVTLDDDVTVHDPRIIPISLSSLLWTR
jgi:predicted AAA+ superfamily ATPase